MCAGKQGRWTLAEMKIVKEIIALLEYLMCKLARDKKLGRCRIVIHRSRFVACNDLPKWDSYTQDIPRMLPKIKLHGKDASTSNIIHVFA
jgi:hypothetical protein